MSYYDTFSSLQVREGSVLRSFFSTFRFVVALFMVVISSVILESYFWATVWLLWFIGLGILLSLYSFYQKKWYEDGRKLYATLSKWYTTEYDLTNINIYRYTEVLEYIKNYESEKEKLIYLRTWLDMALESMHEDFLENNDIMRDMLIEISKGTKIFYENYKKVREKWDWEKYFEDRSLFRAEIEKFSKNEMLWLWGFIEWLNTFTKNWIEKQNTFISTYKESVSEQDKSLGDENHALDLSIERLSHYMESLEKVRVKI